MELLQTMTIAHVRIFDVRLSEGEIEYIVGALHYLLGITDDTQIQAILIPIRDEYQETPGETRQFLEGTCNELQKIWHSSNT